MDKRTKANRDAQKLCTAVKKDGERCSNYALQGGETCRFHGGQLTGKARVAAVGEPVLQFWDPDAPPVEDVGEALLRLAGRMTQTMEYLGETLNERLETHQRKLRSWYDALDSVDEDSSCPVCGHDPRLDDEPVDPLDDATSATWRFLVKELSSLLPKIESLGLMERQVALQEQTALMFGQIVMTALNRAGLDEDTAQVVRGSVIEQLAELEVRA